MQRLPHVLLALYLILFAVCAIDPYDRATWWAENIPIVGIVVLLVFLYPRYTASNTAYVLMSVLVYMHTIGGHYTFERVPFGWVTDAFGFERNHYDRIGHFAQGFVPAILAREILLRRSPLRRGKWLFFLIVSVCLAFSAFYELIEWWTALIGGDSAEAFLGTQGDVWDTQWDMFLALLGAISAQALLRSTHDQSMQAVTQAST